MSEEMKMPTMPTPKDSSVQSVSTPSGSSLGEGASTEAPESESVQYRTPKDDNASNVVVTSKKSEKIEVVALRKGFYGQLRRKEGDKFKITSEKEFGDWFTCVDPVMEKKRKEFIKKKKAGL